MPSGLLLSHRILSSASIVLATERRNAYEGIKRKVVGLVLALPSVASSTIGKRRQVMKRVMVRYKVKADRSAENEGYIRKVFEQLKREHPSDVRYASFKLHDGVSFVHIVSIEVADGSNPLRELSACNEFTARIRDRCEEPPVSMDLNEVGSYRFLGESG